MLCIRLNNIDPFFCLAAEEYLLKKFREDIFMLWQSENTVVVGKHQNAMAEINYRFVRENNIQVARRISGGGTVFHDAGNVNFSYIKNVNSPAEISFRLFTEPVVEALARLGVTATTSGRNDLLAGGLKISGNAEHVFKNRVLHHGTLLYDSDLDKLGLAIKVVPGKYVSKAVQSNRSTVTNISSMLREKIGIEEFIQFMLKAQLENPKHKFFELTENDWQKIQILSEEKLSTREWKYGYSPKYTFVNELNPGEKTLNIRLEVEKGIILNVKISGDYFSENEKIKIQNILVNRWHLFEDVKFALQSSSGKVSDELIYGFF